jgi:hypothetical protein
MVTGIEEKYSGKQPNILFATLCISIRSPWPEIYIKGQWLDKCIRDKALKCTIP